MLEHTTPDCTGQWYYPRTVDSRYSGGVIPYSARGPDLVTCSRCEARYSGHQAVMLAIQEEKRRLDLLILQSEGEKLLREKPVLPRVFPPPTHTVRYSRNRIAGKIRDVFDLSDTYILFVVLDGAEAGDASMLRIPLSLHAHLIREYGLPRHWAKRYIVGSVRFSRSCPTLPVSFRSVQYIGPKHLVRVLPEPTGASL